MQENVLIFRKYTLKYTLKCFIVEGSHVFNLLSNFGEKTCIYTEKYIQREKKDQGEEETDKSTAEYPD